MNEISVTLFKVTQETFAVFRPVNDDRQAKFYFLKYLTLLKKAYRSFLNVCTRLALKPLICSTNIGIDIEQKETLNDN